MKATVLHSFSCSKVNILSICLKTLRPKIPTILILQYVEIHSFTCKTLKTAVLYGFPCSKVKIYSICLKTLKHKISYTICIAVGKDTQFYV